jgi:hypothetical protein
MGSAGIQWVNLGERGTVACIDLFYIFLSTGSIFYEKPSWFLRMQTLLNLT